MHLTSRVFFCNAAVPTVRFNFLGCWQAQQLPAPITSASKLQSQRHELYLLKDAERNG